MSVAALENLLERRWHGAAVHGHVLPLTGWTTGIPSLDAALGPSGVPRGRLTEIFGAASSGKTTLAYALLAACIRNGDMGAYVDPENGLFAPAAEAAGIDLERLIVVQPRQAQSLRRAVDAVVRSGACAVVVLDQACTPALQTHHYARLVSQAEKAGTTLVVLSSGGSQPLASFASLRVHMRELSPLWQPGSICSNGPLGPFDGRLAGYRIALDIAKSKMSAPGKSAVLAASMPDIAGSWPAADTHDDARGSEAEDDERCTTSA